METAGNNIAQRKIQLYKTLNIVVVIRERLVARYLTTIETRRTNDTHDSNVSKARLYQPHLGYHSASINAATFAHCQTPSCTNAMANGCTSFASLDIDQPRSLLDRNVSVIVGQTPPTVPIPLITYPWCKELEEDCTSTTEAVTATATATTTVG
jgi:hypothetical protein